MEIAGASESGCSSSTIQQHAHSNHIYNQMDATHTLSLTFGAPSCGKKKLITVCIHGNETCGMQAVNELIAEDFFRELKDQVTILIGNPKAVVEHKRFIHANLNRIFQETLVDPVKRSDMFTEGHYEFCRVEVVARAIQECDELLDLHSTSSPSPPFAIPAADDASRQFASSLPVDFVIEDLVKVIKGTTIDWAQSHGKQAVCVECGQHEERSSIETAKNVIRCFVHRTTPPNFCKLLPKCVLSCTKSEELREKFKYHSPCCSFQRVECGQLIATDALGEIRCSYKGGAYIVMPVALPGELGEEAWFWGECIRELRY